MSPLWLTLPLLLLLQRAAATGGWSVVPDDPSACGLTLDDDGRLDDGGDPDDAILLVTGRHLLGAHRSSARIDEDLFRPVSVPSQRLFRPPRSTSA